MSYSAPAGEPRKPGEIRSGQGKPPQGTSNTPGKSTGNKDHTGSTHARRSTGAPKNRPSGPGGSKNKKRPVTAVKVTPGRSWGTIAIFGVVGLLIAGILGYSSWQAIQGSKSWQERLLAIQGVQDFTTTHAQDLAVGNGNHVSGRVQYFATPSVGGNHNPVWQNCMGDVYPQQISSEHATHSLEHGAVWVTYDPAKLPAEDVERLAGKVRGTDYMLMSPFPGQPFPISLQVWGYQLRVDSVSDKRIDEFIRTARLNASVEPGATCSGGITAVGVEPQTVPGAATVEAPPAPAASPVG